MSTATLFAPGLLQAVEHARTESRSRAVRSGGWLYCGILVLLPLLAIPFCIALGSSDWFLHHGASVWVQSNDAIFAMKDRQCDVLVYGDSTAMTGIDPDVVTARTGLTTCNIAVTNAVLAVTGNLTLDHFLAHNGRPRVLLVQLSPDDFQRESRSWHRTIYPEGMLEVLRHGQPGEARQLLLSHPQEAIAFAGYAAEYTAWYAIKDAWFRLTGRRAEEDRVVVRNGFFTPPSPARTACLPTDSMAVAADAQAGFSRSLVAQYRGGYAGRAGEILVDVAPIPACDEHLEAFRSALAGVTSNPLLPLPIGLFNDGRHYTADGSQVVSRMVADEVMGAANRQTPALARGPDDPRLLASLRTPHRPGI